MILTGLEIEAAVARDDIVIRPYSTSQVTTNSYDFCLGPTLVTYTESVLDPHKANRFKEFAIPADGYVLRAGQLYLASTQEVMGSTKYVPIIKGKSSIARLGLFIHATADLIDIGSINQWTLQLIPTLDVRDFPGMLIGQVTFWVVKGHIDLYSGKYQGSVGPVPSLAYRDKLTT